MAEADAEERARSLAAEAIGAGDPTAWFEQLYLGAEAGEEVVPWDRGEPHPMLVEWAGSLDGRGRSALVVGCGLGEDAEYIAGLGFDTMAFDIAPTAVQLASRAGERSSAVRPCTELEWLTPLARRPVSGKFGREAAPSREEDHA
jgi:hypothetical protein